MSGDLISRKDIIDQIINLEVTITGLRAGKSILNEVSKKYLEGIINIIDNAETAYDVDEVMKQLEKIPKPIYAQVATLPTQPFLPTGRHSLNLETAVEIIKCGGKRRVNNGR